MVRIAVPALVLACLVSACDGNTDVALESVPLVVAAGSVGLDPEPEDRLSATVDLDRVGLDRVSNAYDFTTPADEPFLIDVVTRNDSNTGPVRISVAHVRDADATPIGGVESLAEVGIIVSASGVTYRGEWVDSTGDGFARITLRGSITRSQVIAVEADNGGGAVVALIHIRIGPFSEINLATRNAGDYDGVIEEATLYSSDSWSFGLPTVAVSGDRTSVVCYEGDLADPRHFQRYEMRLQYDNVSHAVTGGGSEESSPDSGNWRDHEIAALFNVLALAHSGTDEVTLKLSFDRGASFGQTERVDAGPGFFSSRLVQIAIAADYSLAMVFWRANRLGASELVLVEGVPLPFPSGGSPAAYEFDPPQVLRDVQSDVSPVLLGAAWSEGGDLVVGYGFTSFQSRRDGTWRSLTQFRCAVRPWGGVFRDTLVEEEEIVGKDPSVSLVGSGDGLRIFYAYEGRDGVRLRDSRDGGRTFSGPIVVGDASSHMPTVLARREDDMTRVDLLYLGAGDEGMELRLRHWDGYDSTSPQDYRLTTAEMTESEDAPAGRPIPGAGGDVFFPEYGFRITQVAWFGYDAVLDGDDVVVVYDEETFDAYVALLGAPFFDGWMENGGDFATPAGALDFDPAVPPPLAPGMTEVLPPPNPDHLHQLKLIRLD